MNSIPEYFKNYRQFIPEFSRFEASLYEEPILAIRRNKKRFNKNEFHTMLAEFIQKGWIGDYEADAFLEDCYLIKNCTINLGGTWEHQVGVFYILGRSSQLAAHALDVQKEDMVLDMTAAPGGKSLILAEKVGEYGLVIANELEKNRCFHMKRNFDRMGYQSILTRQGNALDLNENFKFEKILLDGPCSSEGTFRCFKTKGKYFESYNLQWRKELHKVQYKLLRKAISLLAKGGTLVYSTCTYSPLENEYIVQQALDEFSEIGLESIPLDLNVSKGILNYGNFHFDSSMNHCIRIYPHQYDSWGFFVAKIVKRR